MNNSNSSSIGVKRAWKNRIGRRTTATSDLDGAHTILEYDVAGFRYNISIKDIVDDQQETMECDIVRFY